MLCGSNPPRSYLLRESNFRLPCQHSELTLRKANCFISALGSDGCSNLGDFKCHCQKADMLAQITPCVAKACPADAQAGKHFLFRWIPVVTAVDLRSQRYPVSCSPSAQRPAIHSQLAPGASQRLPPQLRLLKVLQPPVHFLLLQHSLLGHQIQQVRRPKLSQPFFWAYSFILQYSQAGLSSLPI